MRKCCKNTQSYRVGKTVVYFRRDGSLGIVSRLDNKQLFDAPKGSFNVCPVCGKERDYNEFLDLD